MAAPDHSSRVIHRWLRLLLLVTLPVSPTAFSAPQQAAVIGEHLRDTILESPHPYPASSGSKGELVWSDHFSFPGARYLVFEFEKFELAPGDWVEVRDPKRRHVQIYSGKNLRLKQGAFITRMIAGPEAYIELYSRTPDHDHYGYRIERITRGYDDLELAEMTVGPEAICNTPDQEDAVCYQTSFPDVYERSRAVARILMDGVELCTAWLISCENHLITANHCTWEGFNFDSQEELDRMEFQFMYQDPTCGGIGAVTEYSFLGGTYLESDADLDYTLIQAPPGEDPAATYGWLAVDDRLPDIDELMYVVGHQGGRPKEISLYSTEPADQNNPDGFCEVYSTTEAPCGGTEPEIGYFCDTEGAGSGSPVLSRNTNRVIALHHCGNCPNRGVRIQNIWASNQAGLYPLPSCSLFSRAGSIELDRGSYGCGDTISIQVTDASLLGAGSQAVTLWSDIETSPETVILTETPADSGTFTGAMDTVSTAPSGGDGLLSVSHGDTVTARYIDADDGLGGTDVPREAMASADCGAPVISVVQAVNVLGTAATVVWNTHEPADSRVDYSTAPPAWLSASDTALVTAHGVDLSGLSECSDYFFRVQSTDEAGNASMSDRGGLYHSFTTGADMVRSFPTSDPVLPIIDRSSTYSTIQVTETAAVVDVNVTVNITHVHDGDVEIYLRGPNGVEIDLSSDNGGAGANYTGTVFDDEAATPIRTGSAPFAGSYSPEQPLSTFDGLSAAGSWILRVYDDEIEDAGTLDSWSLTLMLPPKACGPHVGYDSHTLDLDDCGLGGPGDGDAVWDAGEEIDFSLALKNDGTDPLTGVAATVSALTPGVTVLSGSKVYGDLPVDATASPGSPYVVHLPDSFTCGTSADFRIDITASEGTWDDSISQTVGRILPTSGTVLDEDFDITGIPSSWTVVDGGQTADTWFSDSAADPQGCASLDPGLPVNGNWAAVDSDCAGEVNMDESLVTPILDLGDAQTVTLEFDHYFYRGNAETADVDVRSSLTGGSWVTVAGWTASTSNPSHEIIDITAQAAGAQEVEIRWHYDNANFDWYWYLDNVQVSFTAAGGCDMSTCLTGSPPGEQSGAGWNGPGVYSWDVDAGATAGYTLYRGMDADLIALESAENDSCLRFTGVSPGDNMADLSTDSPPSGGFFWYLVTGWNSVGEGTAGIGAVGTRIVNDDGTCGP